jgi:hypothetical protein
MKDPLGSDPNLHRIIFNSTQKAAAQQISAFAGTSGRMFQQGKAMRERNLTVARVILVAELWADIPQKADNKPNATR